MVTLYHQNRSPPHVVWSGVKFRTQCLVFSLKFNSLNTPSIISEMGMRATSSYWRDMWEPGPLGHWPHVPKPDWGAQNLKTILLT